jgi:hypothetical protein
MARAREVILDQDEDIVAYEHHLPGRMVRVMVGFGTIMPDGEFKAAEEQNYENFIIQGVAYDNLMAATETKPAGVFRKEDLWQFVDQGRANVVAEREKIKQERLKQEAVAEAIAKAELEFEESNQDVKP